MNQRRQHALRRQAFEVLTGLAKPRAVQPYDAHLKLSPNEVIQWDTAGDQVSPRRPWRDYNFLFLSESLDGLDLNQRDLTVYPTVV